ncbi:autotransporter-associated beta strand repeat-containing protein [Cephaloticoccus primus]|uniref:autotransporter-associated beta strand repeat-containing protein n=1 Tax=Cephaloticoccus primus TaxID=1548207 RepID=UPI0018D3B6C2|nr:autotransporter-associated beta strand repeat-containing protein [Cephaloticoccus primus]
MPPAGTVEWSGAAADSDWGSADNWQGSALPPAGADVLFGNAPSGEPWSTQAVTNNVSDLSLRSLWFDSGFDYVLSGSPFLLGEGLDDGGRLITVRSVAGVHSEVTFESAVNLSSSAPSHVFRVFNENLGGLRFNGTFGLSGHTLLLEGPGPMRFSGAFGGGGELRVNTSTGHVVFANTSAGWAGTVHVDSGMAVASADGALGSSTLATQVAAGATLAFRQLNWGALGPSVNYESAKTIEIAGLGVWRHGEGHVGALYSDGGNNTFAGDVVLLGDASVGARVNRLTLAGVVSGSGSFIKVGRGIVRLSNTGNSYTGATIIKEGGLWIASEAALQGGFGNTDVGTNLILDGGVLAFNSDMSSSGKFRNFERKLGTGPGQIQWTGSGGFSRAEFGNPGYVELTNEDGVVRGKVTWGKSGFVPIGSVLMFGAEGTGGLVSFHNPIDLAGGQREIWVHRETVAGLLLGGELTNGGLIKTGTGRLIISGHLNYSGPTEILEGSLERPISSYNVLTNFQLGGGTFGLEGDTVMLGVGAGQVQWMAGKDGGLAHFGGLTGTIRLNGSQDKVTWGQQYFVGLDNMLIIGAHGSAVTHIWDTKLDFAGGERTIRTADSRVMGVEAAVRAEVKVTQPLSNGSLRLTGDGRLDMAVENPDLEGSVTVEGAELRLNEDGSLANISELRIGRAGRVTLDNSGTHDSATGGQDRADRVKNDAPITLSAGTLRFLGSVIYDSSETLGALTLAGGANTIDVVNNGNVATLTLASLKRIDASSTINFTNSAGTGTYGGGSTGPRLWFSAAPALSGGILPYATVNGSQWATVTSDGALVPYNDYWTGAPSTWAPDHNVSINTARTVNGTLTINSLRFEDSWVVDLVDNNTALNITSGGFVATAPNGQSGKLVLGRLTTAADNLYVHIANSQFNLSAAIFGSAGFVKSGPGALALHGPDANTYTGTTYVNEGILSLQKDHGVTAIAGDIVVGDFKGRDTLLLFNSHQIADTAKVTLRGVQPRHPSGSQHVHEGILQFNNGPNSPGVREAFDTLHIEGRGVLDFSGGEIGKANYLILNHLTFADDISRLIIRRWVEFADYLLVRRSGNETLIPAILSQINFDGYGDARWIPFDDTHWQITPVPEPATYGTILGAAALVLALWHRRRLRKPSRSHF